MNSLLFGYNTNGFAHHDPYAAVTLLHDLGYGAVGLTLDHGCLNPFGADLDQQLRRMRALLQRLPMRCVVETGARYLLDPRKKHEPTLLSPTEEGRRIRGDFLRRAIDIGAELRADCISLWSGILPEPLGREAAFQRLIAGLEPVLDHARQRQVVVAFEPEPGMFIDTLEQFAELRRRLDRPDLYLTLDIGHLHCLGEVPIADQIRRWSDCLRNVHLEDMRAGVHEHLMFGDGQIAFPPVLAALRDVAYAGGVYVELSRHSHVAPEAARRAIEFLTHVV